MSGAEKMQIKKGKKDRIENARLMVMEGSVRMRRRRTRREV